MENREDNNLTPTVEIIEQPAEVNERFRNKTEGKPTVLGVNSAGTKVTYPSFRLNNYTGTAVAVISCVTMDTPYKSHPNSLVGKHCHRGVCKIEFNTDQSSPTVIQIKDIAIDKYKKGAIEEIFKERHFLRIDPFRCGFRHKDENIVNTAVRLCIQVILKVKKDDKVVLDSAAPVVTNIIYDRKFFNEFMICEISDVTSPACGGKKIMLLCNRISKSDIKIRLFQEGPDRSVVWEAFGEMENGRNKENVEKSGVMWEAYGQVERIHRQVAITFRTPPYKTVDIEQPVAVYMEMVRPSDNRRSEKHYFRYFPDYSNDKTVRNSKKRKICETNELYENMEEWQDHYRRNNHHGIETNIPTDCGPSPCPDPCAAADPQPQFREPLQDLSQRDMHSNVVHAYSPANGNPTQPTMQLNVPANYSCNQRAVGGVFPQSNASQTQSRHFYSEGHAQTNNFGQQSKQFDHFDCQNGQYYPQYLHSQQHILGTQQHHPHSQQHNLHTQQHNSHIQQHNSHIQQHNSHIQQHNSHIQQHNSHIQQHYPHPQQHHRQYKPSNVNTTPDFHQQSQCYGNEYNDHQRQTQAMSTNTHRMPSNIGCSGYDGSVTSPITPHNPAATHFNYSQSDALNSKPQNVDQNMFTYPISPLSQSSTNVND